jgi:cell wall-associated NlpC family hydrolase
VDLPRNSIDQAACGRRVRSTKKLEAGDLLFFTSKVGRYNRKFPMGVGHVAIYVGNDRGVHAKYKKFPGGKDGGKVKLDSLDYFLRRRGDFVAAKRIL